MRTNKSPDGSPVERRKSWEVSTMVRKVEGSPVGHIKSQESNPVVRTVSYYDILIRNVLLS